MKMAKRDVRKRWVLGAVWAFAVACVAATQVRAEVNEIKITKQPGMLYSDRKSTRLNSSHGGISRMPSSA